MGIIGFALCPATLVYNDVPIEKGNGNVPEEVVVRLTWTNGLAGDKPASCYQIILVIPVPSCSYSDRSTHERDHAAVGKS